MRSDFERNAVGSRVGLESRSPSAEGAVGNEAGPSERGVSWLSIGRFLLQFLGRSVAVEVHDGDSMHNNIADWLRDECGEDIQARLCVEGKASPYADDLNALQLALVSDGRDTVDDNDEHRTYWGRP